VFFLRFYRGCIQQLMRLPLGLVFGGLHGMRFLRLTSKHQKALSLVASENQRCLLNDGEQLDFTWTAQRRKTLDYAATFGRNKFLISQLDDCARLLDRVVKPLHQDKKPVVLAPMHMVSDILTGIVASKVYPGHGTVIVSANADYYTQQDRLRGGVNLTYCSIHDNAQGIAKNIMAACMTAMENRTNIIVFPDIVPDYTYSSDQGKSSKLQCRLFGRPANLHNGVERMAKMLSAEVVFYYLYYDRGIKIHIHPPVSAESVSDFLPVIIEKSIRDKPHDWLLWHLHSLYFINE